MSATQSRLVLITPAAFEPAAFAPAFAEALAAADVAAVILDLGEARDEGWRTAADALRPLAQDAGSAFILRDRADLVRPLGADGVHVSGSRASSALPDALAGLKPDFIVGAGDCTTRHAAMLAGEAGPDYVFLGRLAQGDESGDVAASGTLVDWWSGLFEIPGMAMAAESWQSVGDAAGAGADFVAVRDLVWDDAGGAGAGARRAAGLLAARHAIAA